MVKWSLSLNRVEPGEERCAMMADKASVIVLYGTLIFCRRLFNLFKIPTVIKRSFLNLASEKSD